MRRVRTLLAWGMGRGGLGACAVVGLLAAACTPQGSAPDPGTTSLAGNGGPSPLTPPRTPDQVDDDAGQLVGAVPNPNGAPDAGPRSSGDAGGDALAATDAPSESSRSGDDLCPPPLDDGDLAIVELMIASQDGDGDQGQWIEVQSTRACTLNLNGLHAETSSPTIDTLDVTRDVLVPPNGIFVIANTLDPSLNDSLPTAPLLLAWTGASADVLQTAGGTVTLSNSATGNTIDSVTYLAFAGAPGTSLSFPADCAWNVRSDWTRWSYSTASWYASFFGTPNAPNTDVTCY